LGDNFLNQIIFPIKRDNTKVVGDLETSYLMKFHVFRTYKVW